jgi:hypothetical protein
MVMISLKAKKLPHLIVVGIIVIVQCKSLHVKQANKEYSIIFTEKILRRNIKDKLLTFAENIRFYLNGSLLLTNHSFKAFTWNVIIIGEHFKLE